MGKYEQPTRRPAVVAGASSGIGAETAQALAAAGHPVALGARRVDRCEELAAAIRADGGEAVAHVLDVADDASVADFAAKAAADLGDIEVVVSNAALIGPGSLLETTAERLRNEVDVNLLGPHRLIRAFVPGMVERQRGDIVFISSDVALRARPFMGGYSATKAGLEGLVASLQMELEGTGVRASIVRPGPDLERDGHGLGPRRGGLRAQPVGQVGPRPSLPLPQGPRHRGRDHHGRQRTARRPPQPCRRQPRSPGGEEAVTTTDQLTAIPEVSTVLDDQSPEVPEIIRGTGHLPEMRVDPIGLFTRVREECGDIGRFRLADKDVVLVTGAEANEAFFRAPDDVLDQAAAYPFMTPIFGKGVVFDASPEERQQMLKNQALRGDMMRGHAQTIEAEIRRMVADWGDEGEIDLLDFFAELTIYTTSSCLIGKPFREELNATFAHTYHQLEQGTDAIAYVDPYADIESFAQRDAARETAGRPGPGHHRPPEGAGDRRQGGPRPARRPHLDRHVRRLHHRHLHLDDVRRPPHVVGHGVLGDDRAAPPPRRPVRRRRRARRALRRRHWPEVSFQALRSIPVLESALKETLRLHPPLIILMRLVQEDFELMGHTIPAGTVISASPKVSNRIEEDFPKAEEFDPGRYIDPRQEDLQNRWTWIPFGAGKHRCVGNAFAMMQMKAIFSVILRDYEFEAAQPLDSYRDDTSRW